MENKSDGQASRDTGGAGHGDGRGMGNGRLLLRGSMRSFRPGAPCPETVLVAVMSNGSYLLVGYPQGGPTAWVVQNDADPLRQALQTAFGSPAGGVSGDTRKNQP